MTRKKASIQDCVTSRQAPLVKQRTGKGAHPRNFTRTLYDKDGKLVDDGDIRSVERSYWEHFVDKKQAAELKRRLELVESAGYVPGTEVFLDMDVPEAEDDDEQAD